MQKITTFEATGTRGEIYFVEQWRAIVGFDKADPADATRVEDLGQLRTTTGLILQRLSKGKYLIVKTGEELTSDDPDAP